MRKIWLLSKDPQLVETYLRAAQACVDVEILQLTPSLVDEVLEVGPMAVIIDPENCGIESHDELVTIIRRFIFQKTAVLILKETDQPLKTEAVPGLELGEAIPRDSTLPEILEIVALSRRLELTFWGVRGSLPVCGRDTLRYGGSTSCVSLRIGSHRHFIFDAGTGIRNLSRHLTQHASGSFQGHLLISHAHSDHLSCIPFFEPLFDSGNEITLMGPRQDGKSFRTLLEGHMNGIYFPLHPDQFRAKVTYLDLHPGSVSIDGISLNVIQLDHPGYCLGYRIDHEGRSMAYITDNELGDKSRNGRFREALTKFLENVDVLIHDTTYLDRDYPKRVDWGHSTVEQTVELALEAGARHLFLFHHDPEQNDSAIDIKLATARALVHEKRGSLICHAPNEGDRWDLLNDQPLPSWIEKVE